MDGIYPGRGARLLRPLLGLIGRGDRPGGQDGDGRMANTAPAQAVQGEIVLTVTNRVDLDDRGQDEVYEFTEEGQRRTFGRDDATCDIVIWQAHTGVDLARVAGEIWRWDGELWVRNLAQEHEIGLIIPGQPPDQPLRKRLPGTRGAACAIPAPLAAVVGPGGTVLEVQQVQAPVRQVFSYGLAEATVTAVPEVPAPLRPLAVALCEPLLNGKNLPATYSEVMVRLAQPSRRVLRKQVEELCGHYTRASPDLADRVDLRRRLQESAQEPMPQPVLRGAVYHYESPADRVEQAARAKSLSLPDYYEVAHLLVRHYRITRDDLTLLPDPAPLRDGTR